MTLIAVDGTLDAVDGDLTPPVTLAPNLLGLRDVAFGDSHLAADGPTLPGWRYIHQLRNRWTSPRLDNYASGGDTIERAYQIARLVWNHDTDAVVLASITQNSARLMTLTAFELELRRFLTHLRDAYAVILPEQFYWPQVDIDYVTATYGVTMNAAYMDTYNAVLWDVADEFDNAWPVVLNAAGFDPATMVSGRHLTTTGAVFMANQIDARGADVVPPDPVAAITDVRAAFLGIPTGIAGTTTATSWQDASGNGNHLTPVGTAPTRTASDADFAGVATVSSAGVDRRLKSAAFAEELPQPNTIVVACKPAASGSYNWVDGIDGTNHRHLIRRVGGAAGAEFWRASASGANVDTPAGNAPNLPRLVTAVIDNEDATYVEINGVEKARGTTGAQSLTGVTLGASTTATNPVNGKTALLAVIPGVVNPQELYVIESYAAATLGLAVTPVAPSPIAPVDPPALPVDLVALTFDFAYYAGGDWGHPDDGDPVTSIPDASGNARHALQADAAHQAIYTATGLNGAPCFQFDDAWHVADFGADLTQPATYVVVGYTNLNGSYWFLDGDDETHRCALGQIGDTDWRTYAGATLSGGDPNRSPHLLVAVHNGASSSLDVDGVQVASGNAGTQSISGVTLGASFFGFERRLNGGIGLAARLPGVISAGDYDDLKAWVEITYGIAMAG